MAATRKDRGNSWASRAPLNDDRAPIVAKLVEATFSSWVCSWGPGHGLFCRLLTGGLTLSAAKLRTWENISLPTLAPTLKRSFSWSGKAAFGVFFFFFFFFFFLLELPSSHLQMDSRMCSAQKCAFWQRGAEPTTCKGPERLLSRTSAVSELDVPTTYHKGAFLESSTWSLCHVLCECHNKAGVGTNVDIRSSNSFLVQRICLHSDTDTSSKSLERELRPHCRFLLPVTHAALGDEIAEASFRRCAEPNTRIKNRYRYSCLC